MKWWERGVRIVRIGLLVVAGSSLLLYASGIPGVWWHTPWRVVLQAHSGVFSVNRFGPGAVVGQPGGRAGFGGPRGVSVSYGTSGMTQQTSDHWLWTTHVMRGVGGPGSPAGGPPPRPGSYSVIVMIRLGRLAAITGALGCGLLFVRTNRHPRGACTTCGYDLSGLAEGSACPECGEARV